VAIQYVNYSGGVSGARQNVTFTASLGTKQELINEIETVLLAAGWTTISGHGTTTLVMQSAMTPQSLQMGLTVKDNGGNCVTLSIKGVSGTPAGTNTTSGGGQLLPAVGKQWRLVANAYQAFIYNFAAAVPVAARDFVGFGVPWLASNLSGSLTQAIWMQASGGTDTDTNTTSRTLRNWLINGSSTNTSSVIGWQATITNGTLAEASNCGSDIGMIGVGLFGAAGYPPGTYYRFWGNDNFIVDPWIFWGATGPASEAMCMGMLWEAAVITDSMAGETVIGSFTDGGSSHTAVSLTHNNIGTAGAYTTMRGTLILITS
jgi:hypothetical protein